MKPSSFPLHWPENIPRAKYTEGDQFKTTLRKALENVEKSLKLFAQNSGKKLDGTVISSNVGGLSSKVPTDSGVAVWFTWDGLSVCIAVDRYKKVEANLQAIHHIIEARRTELRHGTLALVRATFTGFLALPSAAKKPWWEVLEIHRDSSLAQIKDQYRFLAVQRHPDKQSGSDGPMIELNAAYQLALKDRA